jgi:hypothetical protein
VIAHAYELADPEVDLGVPHEGDAGYRRARPPVAERVSPDEAA